MASRKSIVCILKWIERADMLDTNQVQPMIAKILMGDEGTELKEKWAARQAQAASAGRRGAEKP
jgi:hypothetical protein